MRLPGYVSQVQSMQYNKPQSTWCWPQSEFWQTAGCYPLTLNGARNNLRALFECAVNDSKAQTRLRSFGGELVCYREECVEFRLQWKVHPKLLAWLTTALTQSPALWPSRLVLQRSQ